MVLPTDTPEGSDMESLFSRLQTAARKRAAYNRTVAELSALPLDSCLDLDIYKGDIPKIARAAVYGK
ncbi:MAG: hypothetical protein AAF848_07080 [Pseudomonadota bacterium]